MCVCGENLTSNFQTNAFNTVENNGTPAILIIMNFLHFRDLYPVQHTHIHIHFTCIKISIYERIYL